MSRLGFPKPIKDWTNSKDHRGRHAMHSVGGCGCIACFTAQQSYLSAVKKSHCDGVDEVKPRPHP